MNGRLLLLLYMVTMPYENKEFAFQIQTVEKGTTSLATTYEREHAFSPTDKEKYSI